MLTTPNPNSPQERMKDFAKKVGRKLGVAAPAEDGGQLVENWIPSQKLKSFIESDFQIVQFRGSYYNVYIPKVNLESIFDQFQIRSPMLTLHRITGSTNSYVV